MPHSKQKMNDHLFTYNIIYVGDGLQFCFIYAWKSGKNPSANKLTISNTTPKIYVFCPSTLARFTYGSKNLNNMIPVVTNIATTIFLGVSFSFLSVTLEHKTPTKITDNILHDCTIVTSGKLTMQTASMLVTEAMKIMKPQMATFFIGILTA